MTKLQKPLYLQHDVNELEDDKLTDLDVKYPYKGYTIFWRACTYMLRSDDCYIRFDKLKVVSDRSLHCPYKDVEAVVNYCIEIGLFHKTEDGSAFYNKRVQAQWEEMERKHEEAVVNGKKGGDKSAELRREASPPQAPLDPGSSPPQANKKENKNQNKNKTQKQTQKQKETQTQEASDSASATEGEGKGFFDYPQIQDLCDEICKKFNVTKLKQVYCQKVDALIKELEAKGSEDPIKDIRDGLEHYDNARAIQEAGVIFGIDQFLKLETFVKLINGAYDDIRKNGKTTPGLGESIEDRPDSFYSGSPNSRKIPDYGVSFSELAKKGLYDHDRKRTPDIGVDYESRPDDYYK